jgi:hypothetical protein
MAIGPSGLPKHRAVRHVVQESRQELDLAMDHFITAKAVPATM